MTAHKIGVDIDGILNQHRLHFCRLLTDIWGKDVDPRTIVVIPVHKCRALRDLKGRPVSVEQSEEVAVFNHPRYWVNMPVREGAVDVLSRLRDELNWKVLLFTHRPWPDPARFPKGRKQEFEALWDRDYPHWKKPGKAIAEITEVWLRKHSIPYDELLIENHSISNGAAADGAVDRFTSAKSERMQVFVEDRLDKAVELAPLCKTVFLMDHPYNRHVEGDLLSSLLRVKSWREIYEYVSEVF